jgi:hypothetical protein
MIICPRCETEFEEGSGYLTGNGEVCAGCHADADAEEITSAASARTGLSLGMAAVVAGILPSFFSFFSFKTTTTFSFTLPTTLPDGTTEVVTSTSALPLDYVAIVGGGLAIFLAIFAGVTAMKSKDPKSNWGGSWSMEFDTSAVWCVGGGGLLLGVYQLVTGLT